MKSFTDHLALALHAHGMEPESIFTVFQNAREAHVLELLQDREKNAYAPIAAARQGMHEGIEIARAKASGRQPKPRKSIGA